MEAADQKALSQLGPLLLHEINIDVLQPYLAKYGLTTNEEMSTLLRESVSNTNKKRKLIYLWLPQKGKDAIDKLIKALKESNEAGTTHGELADKLQAERSRTVDSSEDDHNSDSGVDATTAKSTSNGDPQDRSPSTCSKGSSNCNDDDVFFGDCQEISSDSDSEEETLQDTMQKRYTQVMGPSGVARIAYNSPVGEFRLFCFNITQAIEDYSRMGSECARSIDVWCRVSMNCNYGYFTPLESICNQFSTSGSEEAKWVSDYKVFLQEKKFESILSKLKPYEGYQSVSKPKEMFASCIVNIATSFHERIDRKQIRLEDMKSYFCTLKKSHISHEQDVLITNGDMQDNINKAKDVLFLFFAISPCWDWINFLFLEEHVVKQFGSNEEKRELDEYKKFLKGRWLCRSIQELPDMTHEVTCFKERHIVRCRINAEWDSAKIKQVLKLRKVVASVYNVDLSTVKLLKANRGSIIAWFSLPLIPENKELSSEQIVLLAKHEFLDLSVYGNPDDQEPIVSHNIEELFIALDDSFQTKVNHSSLPAKLSSNVLLMEKATKGTHLALSQPKKIFKNWTNHWVALHTFTNSGKLDIYHNASSYLSGKNPSDTRALYGIDVQMKSDKKKPHILEITHLGTSLLLSFETQTEAQQWFIALKQITGCFRLHLKLTLCAHQLPEDLIVQVKEDSMIFWSVDDQSKCWEWKLSDLKSISLNNALYIIIKSSSNVLLKEDMFVLEGQQLEKLFDLLEDSLSVLPRDHNKLSSAKWQSQGDMCSSSTNKLALSPEPLDCTHKHHHTLTSKNSLSNLTSEESGSLHNVDLQTSDVLTDFQKCDILSEIFSAEPTNTVNHAFSWKVLDEVRLENKAIQLVRTSWYNVSKYFLNRGYRIIISQQGKILAQEKNDLEGKKRIESRWKQIVQAIQEVHVIQEKPKCFNEKGHFQASSVVVESAEAYDYSLPHLQNVYYGLLQSTDSPECLHTGMAQCTIPPEQLKEMYSILSRNSFWLKLWPSCTAQTDINVNYLNEVDPGIFRETLNEPIAASTNATHCRNSEILLYIPRSSKSFEDNLVQTSQLAIDIGFSGKVVVFDWCSNKNSSQNQMIDKAKPELLKFLNRLCTQSNKVHILAVNNAALLLVKSLTKFNHKLGQVIFTKLLSLSSCIFDELKSMVDRDQSLLSQAENITIYHRPKSCNKTLLRSFTVAGNDKTFPKKMLLEPPPLIHKVDIICIGNLSCSQIKIRDYAMDKVIIEDMSDLISLGKTIAYRSSRIQLQCGCSKLKAPIFRSHLPCTLCSRLSYFVMGRVLGLGNFTPMFLEEVSQSWLESRQIDDKIKKCAEIRQNLQLEAMLSQQHQSSTSIVTKSAE